MIRIKAGYGWLVPSQGWEDMVHSHGMRFIFGFMTRWANTQVSISVNYKQVFNSIASM